jgi:hypothetical protein
MKSTAWKLSKEAHTEIVAVMSERARIRDEFAHSTVERAKRLKQLLTGKQLAEKYGVTEQAINYHANRERIAQARKLRAAAKAA